MAGVISRAKIMRALIPGVNKFFGDNYKTYPDQHKELYEIRNTTQASELYVKRYGLGTANRKAEGASIQYDEFGESWDKRFDFETFATGFLMTEEAMDDNLYSAKARDGAKSAARAMAQTKQIKAMAPLINGFTTFKGGDKVSFFNRAHPLVNGAVNANTPSVQADLNETSFEAAVNEIGGWVDDRGIQVTAQPKKVFVHRDGRWGAERLFKSEYRPGTMDNDVNAIVSTRVIPGGYSILQYLTDPDAWYIQTDITDGLIHWSRKGMTSAQEGDFDTGNVKFKWSERYSFDLGDPLCMYGVSGG